ncbi:MAG TPA: c-type cytochrome [Terriglobia bacterium]|nr:c-type cytochrome [Terriglobia bacterium]
MAFISAGLLLGTIFAMELAGQRSFQPTVPYVFSWSQFDSPEPPLASGEVIARGRALYAFHCSFCHGMEGRGDGWRAAFLYPKPRNFTRGIFRFKTVESGQLPTDHDLFRTISVGLQNTAMPAWGYYLTETGRWALVAYLKTFSPYFQEEPPGEPIVLGAAPEITEQRVKRGERLYATVGCADCHGPQGYGDGFAAAGMEDSFGVPIAPRNFHLAGEFKRGRTLRDIALTIHTGNDGTPMPSFHRALDSEQVWDLASFLMSLPVETPVLQRPGCPMRRTALPMRPPASDQGGNRAVADAARPAGR